MASTVVFFAVYVAAGCTDKPEATAPDLVGPTTAPLAVVTGPASIVSRLADGTKCLTVRGGNLTRGAATELQPCDGSPAQQFTFLDNGQITVGNNLCLDASGGAGRNGDAIILWTCHNDRNQRWSVLDNGEIRGINSKCLDVWAELGNNGQPIVIWDCHGRSNQRWDIKGGATTPTPTPTPQPQPEPPPPAGPLPAVPGLVSFGAQTPAGRGGQVIRVTNLNDAGAGSLRAALAAAGPRTVVFEVSGNIRLASRINVLNPYVTVAGQTAPAPGVAVVGEGITIRTHDVLFQHFRVRPGDGPCCDPENRDAIEILGRTGQSGAASGYNVVMDHMSFSWAVDEVASTWWGPLRDVTFADCIIAEGLRVSLKGFNHSKGLLVGDSTRNIATLRTLIAHNYDRSPYLKGYSATVFANNLVYNYAGSPAASVGDPEGSGPTQAAIVGNVFVRGLESGTGRPIGLFGSTKPGSQIYVADNAPGRASAPPADPWSLVSNSAGAGVVAAQPPLWPAGFQAMPSGRVYDHVLASAGAWPAARDAADARVVADARDGTGRGIDSPAQVGGFPALAQQRRTMEQAGMPAAPGADSDGDGYTDLEEWLHALARAAEGR